MLGRDDIPFGEMLGLDYQYVTSWSLSGDLKLIFQTIPALARLRAGAPGTLGTPGETMRRLFTNTAWMTVGLGVAQVLTAVAYWLTARASGPAAFGELAAWVGDRHARQHSGGLRVDSLDGARDGAHRIRRRCSGAALGARIGIAVVIAGAWEIARGGAAVVGLVPWFSVLLGVWVAIPSTTSMLQAPLRAAQELRIVAIATILDRTVVVIGRRMRARRGRRRRRPRDRDVRRLGRCGTRHLARTRPRVRRIGHATSAPGHGLGALHLEELRLRQPLHAAAAPRRRACRDPRGIDRGRRLRGARPADERARRDPDGVLVGAFSAHVSTRTRSGPRRPTSCARASRCCSA